MNRTTAEERALLERLERLERTSHWLFALAIVLALLCVSMLAWQFSPIEPIVEAHGFTLRDPRWRLLAELKARQDGTPVLRLMGDNGRPRAMLHMDSKSAVELRLDDPLGHKRAELKVDREGVPALVLSGADGSPRAVIAVDEAGDAGSLVLRDRFGKTIWSTEGVLPARERR